MGLEDILLEVLELIAKKEVKTAERQKNESSQIKVVVSSPEIPEWKYKADNPDEYFDLFTEQPHDFYADAVDTIKKLKREKRHSEAEELLLWCIDFAEWRAELYQAAPPGRYYKDLAIIRRKKHDYEGEVEILERYINAAGKDANDSLINRLEKAKEYAEQE